MGTADLVIRDERQYLAVCVEVRALTERIESVGEAKALAGRASAAQKWAERAKMGEEQVNLAAMAKLWAERRAGELLSADLAIRRGGSKSRAATLEPLGVTKYESSRWQKLAAVPASDFERAIEEMGRVGRVTSVGVLRKADMSVTKEEERPPKYQDYAPEALHDVRREVRSAWAALAVFSQYDPILAARDLSLEEREVLIQRVAEIKQNADRLYARTAALGNEKKPKLLAVLDPERRRS